jgi:hypothetical protein
LKDEENAPDRHIIKHLSGADIHDTIPNKV